MVTAGLAGADVTTEETQTPLVRYQVDPQARVAVITLDRTEVRNALSQALYDQALARATQAATDDIVRSVVITGSGSCFAAGGDLRELLTRDAASVLGSPGRRRLALTETLQQMPKPTIAAVNGPALGGGLEIAMACTIRLATPTATLGLPETNLGIMPGNGGTQRLVRLVGQGHALEMILTGRPIDARRAAEIGLVNHVVEVDELLPRALEFARLFAARSPRALAAAKDAVLTGTGMSPEAGLAYEHKLFALLCDGADKQEGITAFVEGRPAVYREP